MDPTSQELHDVDVAQGLEDGHLPAAGSSHTHNKPTASAGQQSSPPQVAVQAACSYTMAGRMHAQDRILVASGCAGSLGCGTAMSCPLLARRHATRAALPVNRLK